MAIFKISSYAELDTELRCDAEHIASPVLITKNFQSGRSVIRFSQYGTSKALNDMGNGFPVLRLNEFADMFIQTPSKCCNLISESQFRTLLLQKGDVLICRTNGNPDIVGKAAIVMEPQQCAFASYVFRVRTNSHISPQALTVYLSSKYGKAEIRRQQMISIQTNFSPERFKKCRIPILSSSFIEAIDAYVNKAYTSLKRAKQLFIEAQEQLISTIAPNGQFCTAKDAIQVITLSKSIQVNKRMDAEYYLPRYSDYLREIKGCIEGVATLIKTSKIVDDNYIPRNDQQYKYIELSNIGVYGDITGHSEATGKDLPSRARRIVKKGDVIISSIEGSLQSCAFITDEYDGALCSTGFYVLRARSVNPETLLLLFKSEPLQNLLKRGCSGTILTAIGKDELKKIPIPIIESGIQDSIAKRIQDSFRLRSESNTLLKKAVRGIEMAIDQSEEDAIIWLNSNE